MCGQTKESEAARSTYLVESQKAEAFEKQSKELVAQEKWPEAVDALDNATVHFTNVCAKQSIERVTKTANMLREQLRSTVVSMLQQAESLFLKESYRESQLLAEKAVAIYVALHQDEGARNAQAKAEAAKKLADEWDALRHEASNLIEQADTFIALHKYDEAHGALDAAYEKFKETKYESGMKQVEAKKKDADASKQRRDEALDKAPGLLEKAEALVKSEQYNDALPLLQAAAELFLLVPAPTPADDARLSCPGRCHARPLSCPGPFLPICDRLRSRSLSSHAAIPQPKHVGFVPGG